MSVRLKALSLFIGLYVGSVAVLSFFSLLAIRSTLHQYVLNYMEYQVEPLVEFYQNYYKNPNHYAPMLAEEVISREIASLLIKRGKLVGVEGFLEGEVPSLQDEEIKKMLSARRGIGKEYAFMVKRVGDYQLVLLGKLESIKKVERRILLFAGGLVLLVCLPVSLFAFFLINRLLRPLSYLREISESISRGELNVEIKRSGRKDEFGMLEEAYGNMVEKLKGIILWQ
ncbi:MAG: methyl-accepting chemotaxis protein, partial [Aquificaceae bacterium]|nr:methyl-accepting chemotaxis protein [Aquificaceae bacterium]